MAKSKGNAEPATKGWKPNYIDILDDPRPLWQQLVEDHPERVAALIARLDERIEEKMVNDLDYFADLGASYPEHAEAYSKRRQQLIKERQAKEKPPM